MLVIAPCNGVYFLSDALASASTPPKARQTPSQVRVLCRGIPRGLCDHTRERSRRGPRACGPTWSPLVLPRQRTARPV